MTNFDEKLKTLTSNTNESNELANINNKQY